MSANFLRIAYDQHERQKSHIDLWGAEAEGRQFGVGSIRIHNHQALFLIQTQIPACGDVADAESLPPLEVATAPTGGKGEKKKVLQWLSKWDNRMLWP